MPVYRAAGPHLVLLVSLLGATGAAAPADAKDEPLARIEKIVVAGEARLEASDAQARIIRAGTDERVEAKAALALFEDDQVVTGEDVSVVLLFQGDAAEDEKKAIVGAGTQIRIRSKSSLFLLVGRVLSNVRGFFQVERPDGTLGATGTEFEVRAGEDGATRLLVLEGSVAVEAKVAPAGPPRTETRRGFRLEADAGRVATLNASVTMRNRCQEPHIYEVRAPEGLAWVSFVGERVEVAAGQSRTAELRVKIDATRIGPGTYEDAALVKCLDCEREPGCGPVTDAVPVSVRVGGPAASRVGQLQEVTLGDREGPRKATARRVQSALDWTNDAILAGRPAFPRSRVAPSHASVAERARAFREARYRAVWLQEQGSYETLGHIYRDWGEGAKAVEAFERELKVDPSRERSPEFLADLGEAYRLKGGLKEAEDRARRALRLEPRQANALNALGNVMLDHANLARDQGANAQAQDLVAEARRAFQEAARSSPGRPQAAVARANEGEVGLVLGHIARQDRSRLDEAAGYFQDAERSFRGAQETDPRYPYSATGLGDVYRGLGNVARARGDDGRSRASFARSQEQYRRIIAEEPDLAAAHTGLGTLYADLGLQEQAVQSYTRALQLRPAEPLAYYRLGVLLSRDQPRKAAEYMRTYVDLEAPMFKQGLRVRQAQAVIQGAPLPTPSPGPTPLPTPTPRPTPSPSAAMAKVPKVVGDKREDAVRQLREKGLAAQVREAASCEREGRVLTQDPKNDERVSQGTTVTITVASAGPSPVQVPKLEGMPQDRAEEVLRGRGLRVGDVRKRQTNQKPEGTVLDQKPDADQLLAPGCPVELTVAKPEPLVEVPNFVGMSEEEALQRLPSGLAGIFAPLRRGSVTGQGTGGRVVDQNPKAGQMVSRGTAVDLVIEGGDRSPEDWVEVPDLKGWSVGRAIEALRGRGLTPQFGTRAYPTSGCVIDQKPAARSRVRRDTEVYLSVGTCPSDIR